MLGEVLPPDAEVPYAVTMPKIVEMRESSPELRGLEFIFGDGGVWALPYYNLERMAVSGRMINSHDIACLFEAAPHLFRFVRRERLPSAR